MSQTSLVTPFVTEILKNNPQFQDLDRVYLQNQILTLIGADDFDEVVGIATNQPIELANQLVDYAVEHQAIADNQPAREILEAQLLNLITPPPSYVNQRF